MSDKVPEKLWIGQDEYILKSVADKKIGEAYGKGYDEGYGKGYKFGIESSA